MKIDFNVIGTVTRELNFTKKKYKNLSKKEIAVLFANGFLYIDIGDSNIYAMNNVGKDQLIVGKAIQTQENLDITIDDDCEFFYEEEE